MIINDVSPDSVDVTKELRGTFSKKELDIIGLAIVLLARSMREWAPFTPLELSEASKETRYHFAVNKKTLARLDELHRMRILCKPSWRAETYMVDEKFFDRLKDQNYL